LTEYDLLYLIHEKTAIFWSVFQFWSGVTFAYLAVSYFAARNLNIPIIICLSVIFSAMFFHVMQLSDHNSDMISSLNTDLEKLVELSGSASAAAREQIKAHSKLHFAPIIIVLFGSYIGGLLYLPFNYFRSKRENT
jgi:hypothetical protein